MLAERSAIAASACLAMSAGSDFSFVIYPDSLQKGDREQMLSLSGKFAGGSRVSG
jgi:hypothetical protein